MIQSEHSYVTSKIVRYPLGPASRVPLFALGARHEDGLGSQRTHGFAQSGRTPARAERVRYFHACVVSAGGHAVTFEKQPRLATNRDHRQAGKALKPGQPTLRQARKPLSLLSADEI